MTENNLAQNKEYLNAYANIDSSTMLEVNSQLAIENYHLKQRYSSLSVEKEKLERALDYYKNAPAFIGDVSEIISEKKRAVVRAHHGVVFYVNIPKDLENILKVDDRVVLAQNNLAMLDILPPEKDYRALAFEIHEKPKTSFNDIGGMEKIIQEATETVILPITNPEMFEKFGIEAPKGILIHGQPGTGKTMLAKAIANKTNSTFINLNGAELVHKYIGDGAKVVKDLFKIAKEKSPTIIFIDEIDAVASYRMDITTGADREVNRTLTQLLVEMDGFNASDKVKVIAATNRLDILDDAILRPGRFDRIILVPLPSKEDREKIFNIYLEKMPIANLNLEEILEKTEGASGAQIKSICKEAGIFAIRKNLEKVAQENILEAIEKVLGKKEKEDKKEEKLVYSR